MYECVSRKCISLLVKQATLALKVIHSKAGAYKPSATPSFDALAAFVLFLLFFLLPIIVAST